jgi:hypothetical protein
MATWRLSALVVQGRHLFDLPKGGRPSPLPVTTWSWCPRPKPEGWHQADVPFDSTHMLEDPTVVIQGDRVLHLRYPVRR